MTSSSRIGIIEESQVGFARRSVIELCARLSADETFCGRAAIVVSEMARNLVKYAKGGEVIVRQITTSGAEALELVALDRGPGLKNLAECLRDGFSTAGTMGTGIGAIKRLSDQFEIFSRPGQGTVIWARLWPANDRLATYPFEFSGISVPIEREEVCGDAWDVIEMNGILRAMVVDGLGHGPFAQQASREAVAVFRSQPQTGVASTLKLIDQALFKTRGAAGAIVELNPSKGEATVAGVGNVATRLLQNGDSKSFGCDNGTLGTGVVRINEFKHPWTDGGLLIIHSDGIKSRWNLNDYPGAIRRASGIVTALIY
ncbi:MAG: ATP-binding protein, partial [Verrucomicrobia bacterium]|nr:ATP-binding protein [Verrucomicrobiota bacterium]